MEEKKALKWEKWHRRGKFFYILIHFLMVAGFFAFSGTIAYFQLYATMPQSLKEKGASVPIWPGIVVVAVMLPLSIIFSIFQWNRNEKEYQKRIQK